MLCAGMRPGARMLFQGGCYVRFLSGLGLFWMLGSAAMAQGIHGRGGITLPPPPAVQKIPVTSDYFGTKIVDDYRWLEDANSPATRAFINAENAYTDRYMEQARIRPQVVNQLEALENVEKWSIPIERNGDYFFEKRLAGEEQAAIYMRHGWTGKDKLLVDPAQFSRNPNTSVDLLDVSRDGALVAYGVRQGGADQTTVRVYDVKTGKTLFDELPSGLYWSVDFTPGGKGLFYARGNRQGTLVYEHVLGTLNAGDKLLFGREFYGEPLGQLDLISATVSDDGRYLELEIDRGVPAKRVDIVYRDLDHPDSPFKILVWGLNSRFYAIEAGGNWYVQTDYKAPNGRILRAYPGIMPDVWPAIVPQGPDAIQNFSIVGSKIYVQRLHDVKTEITAYALDGKPVGSLSLQGMGTASPIYGRATGRYGFYSFESYIEPPVIYRLDTVTDRQEVFAKPRVPFDTSQYQLQQVFYTSKDGTRVPMFIAGKKGLKQDGTERLLMTGYGGFDLSMTPEWNPAWAWWMEQGGWFALPNLRGGGEYGETWHEAGMFGKKQNVFDDFYAAAEYLIAHKYTSPEHFAITGRSNGGLLTGAAMTQQPHLWAAVMCGYPLLDMLRYQKFEQGEHWVTEYGSSDQEEQFKYLLKYSPYQNVKKGVDYPAILFFTGADDTRVDPMNARKMTALMQADSASGRPILLHYGMNAGHSSGVGVQQKIQDDADQMTFLWTETGPVSARE